jgi:hypothetical protein
VINIADIERRVKYATKLSELQGIFETVDSGKLLDVKPDLSDVMEDSIAKTCLHILVGLTNQNMRITSKSKKVEKVFKDFNKKVQIKRKMDSIVFNQLGYGTGVIYFDVTKPKIKVYDNTTIEIIHDPLQDEFVGLWQKAEYLDPVAMKQGIRSYKWVDEFIAPDNLLVVPGIGTAYGNSLLEPCIPYVRAKRELVDSLYELVKRLGLLTKVGVELPGDISDDSVDEYLDKVADMLEAAAANTTWILPKETDVEGVRGSGEARIIESVKVLIELLDEEIRKCVFVPDTFLTSLSANRATAKEQRYLIASMVQHIRDLIEESLRPMYDKVLFREGLSKQEYTFSWGNINMPEPEALFTFIQAFLDQDGITIDEVRAFLNLGSMPPELVKRQKQKDEMRKQGIQNQGDIYNQMQNKPSTILSDTKPKGGANSGQNNGRAVQPGQKTQGQ